MADDDWQLIDPEHAVASARVLLAQCERWALVAGERERNKRPAPGGAFATGRPR